MRPDYDTAFGSKPLGRERVSECEREGGRERERERERERAHAMGKKKRAQGGVVQAGNPSLVLQKERERERVGFPSWR